MDIRIVTPATRPENLAAVAASIATAHAACPLATVKWIVVQDVSVSAWSWPGGVRLPDLMLSCTERGEGGNPGRNVALDAITDGHVIFLDDDTFLHPDRLSTCAHVLAERPDAAVIVSQTDVRATPRCIATPANMRPCGVDTGQGCFPRDLIGDLRWSPWSDTGDGQFYQALYARDPSRFVFLPEAFVSIHNGLRR